MRYKKADDIQGILHDVVDKLQLEHVQKENVVCVRSYGSSSRRTIARCHGLGKVMQLGLDRKGFYVLEFLSEKFDKLPTEEQIKVIIHEMMHIPFNFGGGFKHHDYVCEKNINLLYQRYMSLR